MILQLHVTDNELQAMANNLGLEWEYKTITQYRSAYHNRTEEYDQEVLCVKLGDHLTPAKEYFESELKDKILGLIN